MRLAYVFTALCIGSFALLSVAPELAQGCEVLSETGRAWPLVQESLAENNTIENMDRLFAAAKRHGFEVFISPHYFYPTDAGWKFNGALEADFICNSSPRTSPTGKPGPRSSRSFTRTPVT